MLITRQLLKIEMGKIHYALSHTIIFPLQKKKKERKEIFARKNFRENKLSRTTPTVTFRGIKLSRKYSKFAKFAVSSLKVHCSYNCIMVTLQYIFRKTASLKKKRYSVSEKYKAITQVGSGTKPSKVADVLNSPLITMTERPVKNLDPLKDLHC